MKLKVYTMNTVSTSCVQFWFTTRSFFVFFDSFGLSVLLNGATDTAERESCTEHNQPIHFAHSLGLLCFGLRIHRLGLSVYVQYMHTTAMNFGRCLCK